MQSGQRRIRVVAVALALAIAASSCTGEGGNEGGSTGSTDPAKAGDDTETGDGAADATPGQLMERISGLVASDRFDAFLAAVDTDDPVGADLASAAEMVRNVPDLGTILRAAVDETDHSDTSPNEGLMSDLASLDLFSPLASPPTTDDVLSDAESLRVPLDDVEAYGTPMDPGEYRLIRALGTDGPTIDTASVFQQLDDATAAADTDAPPVAEQQAGAATVAAGFTRLVDEFIVQRAGGRRGRSASARTRIGECVYYSALAGLGGGLMAVGVKVAVGGNLVGGAALVVIGAVVTSYGLNKFRESRPIDSSDGDSDDSESSGNRVRRCRLDDPFDGQPRPKTTGDPHLVTFDGVRYSPQAVGEYVLTENADRSMVVQVRHVPYPDSRTVAITSATAMKVGDHRIEVRVGGAATLVVDGRERPWPADSIELDGGGSLHVLETRGEAESAQPDEIRLVWPDGSMAALQLRRSGIAMWFQLTESTAASSRGLLGRQDGDRDDDLSTRDGAVINLPPRADDLYDTLLPSWRLTDAETLFTYEPGTSTSSFADDTFPDERATIDDLSPEQRRRAEEACTKAGIAIGPDFDECVFDVGFSGDESFATDAADRLHSVDGARSVAKLGSGPTEGRIDADGDRHSYTFSATAGERRVFTSDTTTTSELTWTVTDSDGGRTAIAAFADGSLVVDIPATGQYTLTISSYAGNTGPYRFTWQAATTATQPLPPKGDSGSIDDVGAERSYTFSATAGERRVFTSDTTTTSDLTWTVTDSDGRRTAIAAFADGSLTVDIPTTGQYTLTISSYAGNTGPYRFTWQSATTATQPLPPSRATGELRTAGDLAAYTFPATAGRSIVFTADPSTTDGFFWTVTDEAGRRVTSDPMSGSLQVDVPGDGNYTLTISSYSGDTGSFGFTWR